MVVRSATEIDALLQIDRSIWRGRNHHSTALETLDSGYAELAEILPNGGWPLKSIIELVVDEWGNGELQVLLPLIIQLSQQKRQIALIAPPYIPYAPALHNAGIDLDQVVIVSNQIDAKDKWWCAEKMLRHGGCDLVMLWPEKKHIRTWSSQIRRLQVAAEMGNSLGVIFNRGRPADTPVSLRLKLKYFADDVMVEILKSRFNWNRGKTIITPQTST